MVTIVEKSAKRKQCTTNRITTVPWRWTGFQWIGFQWIGQGCGVLSGLGWVLPSRAVVFSGCDVGLTVRCGLDGAMWA